MRRTTRVLCCALLAAAALLGGAIACAGDLVARRGADEVRLSPSACTNDAVMGSIAPESRERFHLATGTFNGQAFAGCWEPMGNVVHILWEDGDQGIVPIAELHPLVDL